MVEGEEVKLEKIKKELKRWVLKHRTEIEKYLQPAEGSVKDYENPLDQGPVKINLNKKLKTQQTWNPPQFARLNSKA